MSVGECVHTMSYSPSLDCWVCVKPFCDYHDHIKFVGGEKGWIKVPCTFNYPHAPQEVL